MKLILTGGFLGSGKTTAIVNASRHLINEGKAVVVITNDQGDQQVDTAFVRANDIPSEEVINGCFCCNYHQFSEKVQASIKSFQPDVIFAEAVGSCTDMIATLAEPLKMLNPEITVIISVFVDAELFISILENRSCFIEESVRYIFKKQLQEADVLVINKKDLLSDAQQLVKVREVLQAEYPGKIIVMQNSLLPDDISLWLKELDGHHPKAKRNALEIDYDLYAAGEAELAWCDQTIHIKSTSLNAVFIASKIIGTIFNYIQEQRLTIGHLKFFLETEFGNDKVSFTTISTSSAINIALEEAKEVKLLINARVQATPVDLSGLINLVISNAAKLYNCNISVEKQNVFRPAYPTPTYRLATPYSHRS